MALGTPVWGAIVVGNSASALAVPYPTSPAAGEILAIHAYCYADIASGFAAPTDWSTRKAYTQSANGGYAVYYKVATGSESGTISMPANASGSTQLARMYKLSGAGSSPVLVDGTADATESASPYVNAGVTPGADGSIVWLMGGTRDCITNNETDGFATWSGGTNLGSWTGVSNGSTAGSDAGLGSGWALQSTNAATGNIQVTLQAGQGTYNGISYSYAVRPGVTAVELTGTLAITSTLAGSPTQQHNLANTLAVAATLTGAPTVEKLLSGTLAVATTLAGALDVSVPLSGTLAVTSTLFGTPTVERLLGDTLAVTSTLAGNPTVEKFLSGSLAVASTLVGALAQDHLLAGTVTATTTLAGAPAVDGGEPTVNLTGTLSITSMLAGELFLDRMLAGTVASQTTLSGGLLQDQFLAGTLAIGMSLQGVPLSALPAVNPSGEHQSRSFATIGRAFAGVIRRFPDAARRFRKPGA